MQKKFKDNLKQLSTVQYVLVIAQSRAQYENYCTSASCYKDLFETTIEIMFIEITAKYEKQVKYLLMLHKAPLR